MNMVGFIFGLLMTIIMVFCTWLGKYLFVDRINKKYKTEGQRGTFTVRHLNYNSNTGHRSVGAYRIGDLYNAKGNCIADNVNITKCHAKVGETVDVEYYDTESSWGYRVRPLHKKGSAGVMNMLMIIVGVFGAMLTLLFAATF